MSTTPSAFSLLRPLSTLLFYQSVVNSSRSDFRVQFPEPLRGQFIKVHKILIKRRHAPEAAGERDIGNLFFRGGQFYGRGLQALPVQVLLKGNPHILLKTMRKIAGI